MAIIGGGVIGLSIAHALRREKMRITVIDAGGEIPAATNAAAGMLAPSFESRAGSAALYEFGVKSLAMWPAFAAALEDETGQSVDFRADGVLGVAFDEAQTAALRIECADLQARGADVEMLSGEEARALEPALSGAIVSALHAPGDAQADPRRLLAALHASFEKAAGIFTAGRVVAIEAKAARVSLRLADGARIDTEKAIIANGAAAGLLNGIAPSVFPVKGEALALAMPEGAFRKVIRAPGAYLCPKAGGRLVIGATEYEGRADYDVDAAAVAAMVANGARAVPAVADYAELERWAGLRPATPDGAPILGRDADGPENLYLALGHYRNGILLAPASAEALCDLIMSRKSVTDLKPFRPERFAGGRHG